MSTSTTGPITGPEGLPRVGKETVSHYLRLMDDSHERPDASLGELEQATDAISCILLYGASIGMDVQYLQDRALGAYQEELAAYQFPWATTSD
ncbi:MAG: hypothetical protein ACRDPE_15800 [Solirubrobacterales bacterium]